MIAIKGRVFGQGNFNNIFIKVDSYLKTLICIFGLASNQFRI